MVYCDLQAYGRKHHAKWVPTGSLLYFLKQMEHIPVMNNVTQTYDANRSQEVGCKFQLRTESDDDGQNTYIAHNNASY
jgi:hypothetical protein